MISVREVTKGPYLTQPVRVVIECFQGIDVIASTDTTSFSKSPAVCSCSQTLSFTLNLPYSSPGFTLSFSLSLASFHVCGHVQWILELPLYSVVLKKLFFQKAVGYATSRQTNKGSITGFAYLGVPFALVVLWCCVRTDGRTDEQWRLNQNPDFKHR